MTKPRTGIAMFALIGAALGAGLGVFAAPTADRYKVTTDVALIPSPTLTTEETSSFWDILTRGQVSRTAALIYQDSRWLNSAARATDVSRSELTLEAAALPETTLVMVEVSANSPEVAEAALDHVLTTAAPEVAAVTTPFLAKVLWPPQDSAYLVSTPGRTQFAAAGALAGLLGGGSIGWYRRRRSGQQVVDHSDDGADGLGQRDAVGRHGDVGRRDGVGEEHGKHRPWGD